MPGDVVDDVRREVEDGREVVRRAEPADLAAHGDDPVGQRAVDAGHAGQDAPRGVVDVDDAAVPDAAAIRAPDAELEGDERLVAREALGPLALGDPAQRGGAARALGHEAADLGDPSRADGDRVGDAAEPDREAEQAEPVAVGLGLGQERVEHPRARAEDRPGGRRDPPRPPARAAGGEGEARPREHRERCEREEHPQAPRAVARAGHGQRRGR